MATKNLLTTAITREPKKLCEHLDNLESQGGYLLEIKSGQKKRQPRQAKMEVRYVKVKIGRPSRLNKRDYPDYVELHAIEAREMDETVPEGEKRILWRLLTTHKIESLEDALEAIYWYSLRWRIDIYHLKYLLNLNFSLAA